MSDFNITVDTNPMARSLDNVNSNVRNVTASVVAMESAVVLAQREASKQICENVDTGFFLLMKSQFDQKIAAVSSKMLSQKQLMETFKKEIDKIMVIMQDDYERIKQRYFKHFNSLDKALETRIHELDKKAYEISRNYKMSQFKNGSDVIKTICFSDDTQLLNVKEASANVKSRSAKSIAVMANDVVAQKEYSTSVKNILHEEQNAMRFDEYLPVLLSQEDSMLSQESKMKNIYSQEGSNFSKDSKYLNQIKERAEDFSWSCVSDDEYEKIKNSFEEKVSSQVSDQRLAKEMLRLFNQAKWENAGGQN